MPEVLFTGYDPATQRVVVVYGSLSKFRPTFWNRRRGYSCVDMVWDDGKEKKREELCVDLDLVWSHLTECGDLRQAVRRAISKHLSTVGVVEVVGGAV